MTQPNPYPTEPPYIEQQLACRKKISLCTSCHHHHPNAHRKNANTHSITSITVTLGLFQTDEAVMHQLQVFTKRICQSILDTKLHILHDMYISHICHFRPMTQPNPRKTNFRPIPDPTQPNPTRGSTQPMDNSATAHSLSDGERRGAPVSKLDRRRRGDAAEQFTCCVAEVNVDDAVQDEVGGEVDEQQTVGDERR